MPIASALRSASSLKHLEEALKRHGSGERAKFFQKFFQTQEGGYGHGDQFWGLTVPDCREFAATFADLNEPDLTRALRHPIHEVRLTALAILEQKFRKAKQPADRERWVKLYLNVLDHVNNWDLVDMSAQKILGVYLWGRSAEPLRKLSKSKNLWHQRVSIIATQTFIRKGSFDLTLELCQYFLTHPHDLMHKACGWMLREVGKRDEGVLTGFLDRYAGAMPRTMLRYAIERLSQGQRKHYMQIGKKDSAV